MNTIKAWIARFRWIGWIVLAGVITVFTLVVRKMLAGRSTKDDARFQMPAVPPAVQRRVQQAEEHATVTRIQASVQAEVHKEALVQVLQVPDGPDGGAERRKRLATLLRNLQ